MFLDVVARHLRSFSIRRLLKKIAGRGVFSDPVIYDDAKEKIKFSHHVYRSDPNKPITQNTLEFLEKY